MNPNKNRKLIIIFTAVNLLFAAVYGSLYYALRQKNAATVELYSNLFKRSSDKEDLARLQKSLENTAWERSILDSFFVPTDEPLAFIEYIEKLGIMSDTRLRVIAVNPPKKKGEKFTLDFTAEGSFQNIHTLGILLENAPYRLSVSRADLKTAAWTKEGDENTGLWKGAYTIILESYVNPNG